MLNKLLRLSLVLGGLLALGLGGLYVYRAPLLERVLVVSGIPRTLYGFAWSIKNISSDKIDIALSGNENLGSFDLLELNYEVRSLNPIHIDFWLRPWKTKLQSPLGTLTLHAQADFQYQNSQVKWDNLQVKLSPLDSPWIKSSDVLELHSKPQENAEISFVLQCRQRDKPCVKIKKLPENPFFSAQEPFLLTAEASLPPKKDTLSAHLKLSNSNGQKTLHAALDLYPKEQKISVRGSLKKSPHSINLDFDFLANQVASSWELSGNIRTGGNETHLKHLTQFYKEKIPAALNIKNLLDWSFSSVFSYSSSTQELKLFNSQITTTDLSFIWEDLSYENTKLRLFARSLYPSFELSEQSQVYVARLGAEKFVQNLEARISFLKNKIKIHSAQGLYADGAWKINNAPVSLEPGSLLSVEIKKLRLSELLRSLGQQQIKGDGFLSGELQTKNTPTGWRIIHAKLQSDAPGVIRYQNPAFSSGVDKKIENLAQFQQLLAQGQQALVFKALDNFHYQQISLSLKRDLLGRLEMDTHLKGSNPDLARSQKFEISIPFRGDLEALLMESILGTLIRQDQLFLEEIKRRAL